MIQALYFSTGLLVGYILRYILTLPSETPKPKMRLADGHKLREWFTRDGRVCFVPHVGDTVVFYNRDGIMSTESSRKVVDNFEYTISKVITGNCFVLKEMIDDPQGGWIPWSHAWRVKCPMVEDVTPTPEEAKAGDSMPTPEELGKFVDKMK